MNRLIEDNRDTLTQLCRRYHVRRLELFGSGADERFDPDTSDLDFLVEYVPLEPGEHSRSYFGLLESLQDLFERCIDLVETNAVSNPYLLESINRSRTVLYAA